MTVRIDIWEETLISDQKVVSREGDHLSLR